MTRYQDEDEREEISWREIDRRRDRSPHAPKEAPTPRERSPKSEWLMKKYRKEADKLFAGKKGTKKHQKALQDLERYHGTDQFDQAAKDYLNEYGLPDDWRTLGFLLDCSDPQRAVDALEAMREQYENRTPAEKQGFKAKVDILAMTASNSDVRELAEEILRAL
jgi:hypothetical protein